jgi:hypothetical protein
MNILRIAGAPQFARPFYFKSLDSSSEPFRTKIGQVSLSQQRQVSQSAAYGDSLFLSIGGV